MPGPIFRVTLISLLAAGLGGGVLYHLQGSPSSARRARTSAAPAAADSIGLAHLDAHSIPPDGYTEFFQSMGSVAFTASHRAAPASSPTPTPAPNSDDDFSVPLPLAREALASVGSDDLAEAVWELAINDPSLAPEDRKDLIEDLNEEGFADPENPAPSELPLIQARLALIERLAPGALDQTNADAFAEAKKDLENMRDRLAKPVVAPEPAPKPAS